MNEISTMSTTSAAEGGTIIANTGAIETAAEPDNVQVTVTAGESAEPPLNVDITDGVTKPSTLASNEASYAYYEAQLARDQSNSNSNGAEQSVGTVDVVYPQPDNVARGTWRDREKPVHQRHLKVYRILGILAIIAFFPLGIPAYFTALKLEEKFHEGIQKGDMAECNKTSRLLEKLLIASFAFSLFAIILILALVGFEPRSETLGNHL